MVKMKTIAEGMVGRFGWVSAGLVVRVVLAVLVLVAGVMGVVALGGSGVLPAKYFWVGVGVWVVFDLLVAAGFVFGGKKHKVRVVFAGLGAVAIAGVMVVLCGISSRVNTFIDAIGEPAGQVVDTKKGEVTKPFVLYISGIDVRSHDLPQRARSDVNILVVVNPITHRILTVNTPRDFYVELASFGAMDKLTHAGTYGVEESIKTLQNLYQTEIDYYARVNFDTLIRIVDSIGGIEVTSDYDFSTRGYHFVKGRNSLDGESALAFSRERKSFAGGDRVRGQHQQAVISAIFEKMLRPDMLWQADSLLGALADSLQTNIGAENLRSLLREQLDSMAGWSIENIAVDGTGGSTTTFSLGSLPQYVMRPNWDIVGVARTKISETLAQ